MKASVRRKLASRKRRMLRRIKNQPGVERHQPMMTASNTHYEISDRTLAISAGGIGAIQLLARRPGSQHHENSLMSRLKVVSGRSFW